MSIAPSEHNPSATGDQFSESTQSSSPEGNRGSENPVDDHAKPVKRTKRRKSTSHLKAVPETLAERESIKAAAENFAKTLDKANPFSKGELEGYGRDLLNQHNLPEKFLGFVMVRSMNLSCA